MTGWVLSTRHRYVTDLIASSDSTTNGHFTNYHRFFSQAVWDLDQLWQLLAQLIVRSLVGADAVIILLGDEILCRKRGLGIFGTGMLHNQLSSSKSKKICHWGHDWVDLWIVVANPWWAPSKVFSLPICMRLNRNRQGLTKDKNKKPKQTTASQKKAVSKKNQRIAAKKKQAKHAAENTRRGSKTPHKTRPELMAEMITMVAAWFPDRQFLLVVDSLYSGKKRTWNAAQQL